MQALRAHRPAIVLALVATLVLGASIRYVERPHATLETASLPSSDSRLIDAQASTATSPPMPISTESTGPPPPEVTAATTLPAPAAPLIATAAPVPATAAPAQQDLSGTWRGEYVDASGKQLLRVVSLSISRVHDDGGIEGTLQYEAASGDGECKLHPRGSTYSAGAQRLQLSPVGCTPHYPKELGVPLDFDGVNPQANALKNGHIEAPTGDMIRVKLRRVP